MYWPVILLAVCSMGTLAYTQGFPSAFDFLAQKLQEQQKFIPTIVPSPSSPTTPTSEETTALPHLHIKQASREVSRTEDEKSNTNAETQPQNGNGADELLENGGDSGGTLPKQNAEDNVNGVDITTRNKQPSSDQRNSQDQSDLEAKLFSDYVDANIQEDLTNSSGDADEELYTVYQQYSGTAKQHISPVTSLPYKEAIDGENNDYINTTATQYKGDGDGDYDDKRHAVGLAADDENPNNDNNKDTTTTQYKDGGGDDFDDDKRHAIGLAAADAEVPWLPTSDTSDPDISKALQNTGLDIDSNADVNTYAVEGETKTNDTDYYNYAEYYYDQDYGKDGEYDKIYQDYLTDYLKRDGYRDDYAFDYGKHNLKNKSTGIEPEEADFEKAGLDRQTTENADVNADENADKTNHDIYAEYKQVLKDLTANNERPSDVTDDTTTELTTHSEELENSDTALTSEPTRHEIFQATTISSADALKLLLFHLQRQSGENPDSTLGPASTSALHDLLKSAELKETERNMEDDYNPGEALFDPGQSENPKAGTENTADMAMSTSQEKTPQHSEEGDGHEYIMPDNPSAIESVSKYGINDGNNERDPENVQQPHAPPVHGNDDGVDMDLDHGNIPGNSQGHADLERDDQGHDDIAQDNTDQGKNAEEIPSDHYIEDDIIDDHEIAQDLPDTHDPAMDMPDTHDPAMDMPDTHDPLKDIPDSMMDRYIPEDPALGGLDLYDYPGYWDGTNVDFHGLNKHYDYSDGNLEAGDDEHNSDGMKDGHDNDHHDGDSMKDGPDDGVDEHKKGEGMEEGHDDGSDIHDHGDVFGFHDGVDADSTSHAGLLGEHADHFTAKSGHVDNTEDYIELHSEIHIASTNTSAIPSIDMKTDHRDAAKDGSGEEDSFGMITEDGYVNKNEVSERPSHMEPSHETLDPYTIPDDAIKPWEIPASLSGSTSDSSDIQGMSSPNSGFSQGPSDTPESGAPFVPHSVPVPTGRSPVSNITPRLVENDEPSTTPSSGIPSKDQIPEGQEHLFGAYVHPSEVEKLSEMFDENTNAASDDKFAMYIPPEDVSELDPDHFLPQIHEIWPGLGESNVTEPTIDLTKDTPVNPNPNPIPTSTMPPDGIDHGSYPNPWITNQNTRGPHPQGSIPGYTTPIQNIQTHPFNFPTHSGPTASIEEGIVPHNANPTYVNPYPTTTPSPLPPPSTTTNYPPNGHGHDDAVGAHDSQDGSEDKACLAPIIALMSYEGHAMYGGNRQDTLLSEDECKWLCGNVTDCTAADYHKNEGSCFVHFGESNHPRLPDDCCNHHAKETLCAEPCFEVEKKGKFSDSRTPPSHIHTDMTHAQCREHCLRNSECTAFQYNTEQYTCAVHNQNSTVETFEDGVVVDDCCTVGRKTLCYGSTKDHVSVRTTPKPTTTPYATLPEAPPMPGFTTVKFDTDPKSSTEANQFNMSPTTIIILAGVAAFIIIGIISLSIFVAYKRRGRRKKGLLDSLNPTNPNVWINNVNSAATRNLMAYYCQDASVDGSRNSTFPKSIKAPGSPTYAHSDYELRPVSRSIPYNDCNCSHSDDFGWNDTSLSHPHGLVNNGLSRSHSALSHSHHGGLLHHNGLSHTGHMLVGVPPPHHSSNPALSSHHPLSSHHNGLITTNGTVQMQPVLAHRTDLPTFPYNTSSSQAQSINGGGTVSSGSNRPAHYFPGGSQSNGTTGSRRLTRYDPSTIGGQSYLSGAAYKEEFGDSDKFYKGSSAYP